VRSLESRFIIGGDAIGVLKMERQKDGMESVPRH
jgi:hypothetical protein